MAVTLELTTKQAKWLRDHLDKEFQEALSSPDQDERADVLCILRMVESGLFHESDATDH